MFLNFSISKFLVFFIQNRVGMTNVEMHNRFDEPTEVIRIEFPSYGQSFAFHWNNTSPGKLIIPAYQTYQVNNLLFIYYLLSLNLIQIGKLTFDMKPLCSNILIPSESTCYCGINNHPEYKQKWHQHMTELNDYELDHILVAKFRNLWQEWTSLVRKQR